MKHVCYVPLVLLLFVGGCNFVKITAIEEVTVEKADLPFDGPSEPSGIKAKREKVEAEIARLQDHPWAGQYSYSHDHGSRVLTLAPENGFVLNDNWSWERTDLYGTVEWDGTHIKLTSEISDAPVDDVHDYRKIHTEYRLVRWGKRLYLIPDNQIIEFCYKINTGNEPRYASGWGIYLLRSGDWEKEAKGRPEIPEEFMPHLLDERVDAVLLSVTIEKNKPDGTVNAVLNKGKKDGLLPGMRLVAEARSEGGGYNSMTLTKVDETQSECLLYYGNTLPEVGQEFSTCPRWMRQINERIQEQDKQKQ